MQESVNILGTEYRIIIDDEMHRTERDGAERRYLHEISLRSEADMLDSEATDYERALDSMRSGGMRFFTPSLTKAVLKDTRKMNSLLTGWRRSPRRFLKYLQNWSCSDSERKKYGFWKSIRSY